MTTRIRQRLQNLEVKRGGAEVPFITRQVIDEKRGHLTTLYRTKDGRWLEYPAFLDAEGRTGEFIEWLRELKANNGDQSATPDNLTGQQCLDCVGALLFGDPLPHHEAVGTGASQEPKK